MTKLFQRRRRLLLKGMALVAAPAIIRPSLAQILQFSGAAAFPDGSVGAPPGTPQYAGLLNSYFTRPPWKVAGVDYHVGIDRNAFPTNASLASAASGTLPSGVTRDSTNQILTLTGNNVTLNGFDFTVGTGWNVNITGSNCIVQNCNFATSSLQNGSLATYNGTIQGTLTQCEFLGSTTIGTVGAGAIGANGTGTFNITYCWVKNSYAIGFVASSDSTVTPLNLVWKYNALENAGCGRASSGGNVHGDWVQVYNAASCTNTGVFDWSFWYQSMSTATADTQGLSLNSANTTQGPATYNEVNNNTLISITGADCSPALIMYRPNLNGSGVINNNYFDPTTMSPAINENVDYNPVGQPGHGPYNGPVTWTGNISMVDGTTIVPVT